MRLHTFAPDSDLSAWLPGCHTVTVAARQHDNPGEILPVPAETEFELTHPFAGAERHFLLAETEGTVLGFADLTLRTDHNKHLVTADLLVHPASRRNGVGSSLLDETKRVTAAHGRTTIAGSVVDNSAHLTWAMRRGFSPALQMARQHLRIDAIPDDRLATIATPVGYRVEHFSDDIPDQWRERYGATKSQIFDAPLGDLIEEERQWSAPQLTAWLNSTQAGRQLEMFVAIDEASETIAGLTELSISRWVPYRAWQHDTVVARAHRGHGLGRVLKANQLRWVREHRPDIVEIETWNASDNPYMLAINTYFGFRVRDYQQSIQAIL